MKQDPLKSGATARGPNAILYDRLERAIIALEYALADARKPNGPSLAEQNSAVARSHAALLSAGEEVQEVVLLLKTVALDDAAARLRDPG